MVNKSKKMAFVFLLYLTIIFGSQNYEAVDIETHCKNESCANITYIKQLKRLIDKTPNGGLPTKYNFPNLTNELSEKEIYTFKNLEQTLSSGSNKSNFMYELQAETTDAPDEALQNISTEIIDNSNEESDATVRTTEVSDILFENASNKSVHVSSTETTIKKINVPTTQMPPSTTSFLLKQNFKKDSICFCDLKVNECDINCCCDEDCSPSHFKVFTKCNNDQPSYDPNYCYKNYFIFGNNTSHKIVERSGGIFCIARENLEVSVDFKARVPLISLKDFNKTLPDKLYTFTYKTHTESEFIKKNYSAGENVWTVQNGELTPFNILHSNVGSLCNSKTNIKYLVDQVITCFIQVSSDECEGKKIGDVMNGLKSTKIISNPGFINTTEKLNNTKICESSACIPITLYLCQSFDETSECLKILENSTVLNMGCWNVLSSIQYQVLHNGSAGILKFEASLWVKKLSTLSSGLLLPFRTEVQYNWVGLSNKTFKRSGNPGYLTGKPVLAGMKIYNVNVTSEKKEAMNLSVNPNDWLSILGSKKGICSFKNRIPINFRENGQFMCSLKLSKDNFTNEKCVELQNNIFKLLIGQDVLNVTKENYFNKFVATFGNSKVEETGDWVQVLIDPTYLSSSHVSFKSNHYHVICKNIITDLFIDVVHSNIGSVLAPQAKILGVSFHFGNHKDLTYHCDSPGCENTYLFQYFKLSTSVRFIDVTKPATDAFAEPLHLETKLPHDFFYPFFSKGYRSQVLSKIVCIFILSNFI